MMKSPAALDMSGAWMVAALALVNSGNTPVTFIVLVITVSDSSQFPCLTLATTKESSQGF